MLAAYLVHVSKGAREGVRFSCGLPEGAFQSEAALSREGLIRCDSTVESSQTDDGGRQL